MMIFIVKIYISFPFRRMPIFWFTRPETDFITTDFIKNIYLSTTVYLWGFWSRVRFPLNGLFFFASVQSEISSFLAAALRISRRFLPTRIIISKISANKILLKYDHTRWYTFETRPQSYVGKDLRFWGAFQNCTEVCQPFLIKRLKSECIKIDFIVRKYSL